MGRWGVPPLPADETLRALRLLDGVKLGERNLKINVDDKTRRFLDEFVAQKKERGVRRPSLAVSRRHRLALVP
jgi:hypothetical protein